MASSHPGKNPSQQLQAPPDPDALDETSPLLDTQRAIHLRATNEPTHRVENVDETENPERPTGFRFAVVYACILMGDFFVGYVCNTPYYASQPTLRPQTNC